MRRVTIGHAITPPISLATVETSARARVETIAKVRIKASPEAP